MSRHILLTSTAWKDPPSRLLLEALLIQTAKQSCWKLAKEMLTSYRLTRSLLIVGVEQGLPFSSSCCVYCVHCDDIVVWWRISSVSYPVFSLVFSHSEMSLQIRREYLIILELYRTESVSPDLYIFCFLRQAF